MTNAAFGKKVLAIAVLACLCAALIAVPAYGFYYVHDDSVSDSSDGLGSYEVFMVVDETAVGGDVHSDLMFVPAEHGRCRPYRGHHLQREPKRAGRHSQL